MPLRKIKKMINKNEKLKTVTLTIVLIFIAVHIFLLIFYFGNPQHSDQVVHMNVANKAFSEGTWYPTASNLYDNFIVAPGLINFLILQLKLFGTMNYNGVFQLLMNLTMLFEVYYIAKHFFSKVVGYIATIIYCLIYSNYMGILIWGTEIPFLFLCLTAFSLSLTKKWYNVLIASALLAMSNTIRPLSILFIVTICLYFALSKTRWKQYALLCIPFFLLNYGYGKINEARMGYFVNTSTTGGTNLLQTANDYADGTTSKGSNIIRAKDSKFAYANNTDKTVFEKDKMWHDAGIEWIKQNPKRYFMMFFKKIPYLYADDTWPERLVDLENLTKKESGDKTYFIMMTIKNTPYYTVCLLAILGIVFFFKNLYKEHRNGLITLLAYFIMGTGGTVLMPVMPRYHYPFLFVLIIFAAYTINRTYRNKFAKE